MCRKVGCIIDSRIGVDNREAAARIVIDEPFVAATGIHADKL